MKVRFKKLDESAVTPEKAHESDAGFDLVAISVSGNPKHTFIGTGIAVDIPKGYVGLLFPRSSVYKKDLRLANSVGVIDSGYKGEVKFIFDKKFPVEDRYTLNDKVGQLVIVPVPEIEMEEVNDLESSDRGEGGFGSTGD